MPPIRVLLAEDHELVRSGIRALLQRVEGIEVVAEAGDGREALKLVATHHPDVVLLDITMPELNGLEVTTRLAKQHPHTRTLIVSMHRDEEYVAQALRAGAAGYLLKDSGSSELELAVRAVARGDRYLSPAISGAVIEGYVERPGERGPMERLSPRQREVLQLVAEGSTTKQAAQRLGLSPKTVEAHRTALMKRVGVHDLASLVRYAVRSGIVPPES